MSLDQLADLFGEPLMGHGISDDVFIGDAGQIGNEFEDGLLWI